MKLNVHWALTFYPILNDPIHWKMCENILQKIQSPNTIEFLDYKKESAYMIAVNRLTAAINNN